MYRDRCLQQPLAMLGQPHPRHPLPLQLLPYLHNSLQLLRQQPLRSLRHPLSPRRLAVKTTCRSKCDLECVNALMC